MLENGTERSHPDELLGWAESEEMRAHNLGSTDSSQAEYWRGQERAFAQMAQRLKSIALRDMLTKRHETETGSTTWDPRTGVPSPSYDLIALEPDLPLEAQRKAVRSIVETVQKLVPDIWRCWQRMDSLELSMDARKHDLDAVKERINSMAGRLDLAHDRLSDLHGYVGHAKSDLERVEGLLVGVIEVLYHHRLLTHEWSLATEAEGLRFDVRKREEEAEAGTDTVSVDVRDYPKASSAMGGEENG